MSNQAGANSPPGADKDPSKPEEDGALIVFLLKTAASRVSELPLQEGEESSPQADNNANKATRAGSSSAEVVSMWVIVPRTQRKPGSRPSQTQTKNSRAAELL